MTIHMIVVEMYYDAAWHNFVGEVYDSTTVSISRYGSNVVQKINPATAAFSLVNTNGKNNPRNAMSDLYGKVGLNTPVRITVDGEIRWAGEVADWGPDRSFKNLRRMKITCGGIFQRLGTGNVPVISVLMTTILALNPLVYLPMIDGSLATIAGTPIASGQTAAANGITFSKIDGPVGDPRKLPEMVGDLAGNLTAYNIAIRPGSISSEYTIDIMTRGVRKDDVNNNFGILEWVTAKETANEVRWRLSIYWTVSDTFDTLELFGYKTNDWSSSITLDDTSQLLLDSAWHHYRIQIEYTGGVTYAWMTVDDASTTFNTSSGVTEGGVDELVLLTVSSNELTSGSIGHIAVYNSSAPGNSYVGFTGRPGEYASSRFARVCTENGIAYTVYGASDADSQPMGPQPVDTPRNVLYDCVATNGGIVWESDTTNSVVFRILRDLYRQDPVLTIDVDTDIVPPLPLIISNRSVRNDVTAKRNNGSSFRKEITTGPMSINAPPNGVGRYTTEVDVNPELDETLAAIASWVCASMTIDEVQYGKLRLDLDANPAIDVSGLDIGSVVQLQNVPAYDDPRDDARLLVTAIEESIEHARRIVTLSVVSADIYDVGIYNDSVTRYDTAGSTLAVARDTTQTSWSVATTSGPLWSTTNTPYDWWVEGERVTVTAMSGASSPQTATVTRSINNVVKTQAVGASIRLWRPYRYGM